jgi:O-antigen/teichoic acid export membrane protein
MGNDMGRHWADLLPLLPLLAAGVLANAGFNLYAGTLVVLGNNRPVIAFHALSSGLFFGAAGVLLAQWPDLLSYGAAALIAACACPLIWLPVRRRLPEVRALPNAINLGLLLALLTLVTALWSEPLWIRLPLAIAGWSAIALLLPGNQAMLRSGAEISR